MYGWEDEGGRLEAGGEWEIPGLGGSQWIIVDHSGGEAAHGSQITNFRLGRGLPREMGGWYGPIVETPTLGYPSNQPVLPHLPSVVDIVIG